MEEIEYVPGEVPEGWRLLEEGEEVETGDRLAWHLSSYWIPCKRTIGVLAGTEHAGTALFIRKTEVK